MTIYPVCTVLDFGHRHTLCVLSQKSTKIIPTKASEWTIIVMFSLLLALWLFRSPKVITGWGDFFGATKFTGTDKVSVKDASASMFVVFITFALPVSYSVFSCHIHSG